ncbi:acyl-CoA desaturase [Adhaeretor mobilis]|uniref:Stearoyl-CoA 9-desaturase n=1 Tax=Adhaeretor mobilis TaxID=1930276 RepID=A0A517N274_9BACT|nr:acyl-CoA desaturase [Adhaeretor mobilis]QDT01225.1 Stearoyl-CoA 9-desaturase [Adhaeretor mobilis]
MPSHTPIQSRIARGQLPVVRPFPSTDALFVDLKAGVHQICTPTVVQSARQRLLVKAVTICTLWIGLYGLMLAIGRDGLSVAYLAACALFAWADALVAMNVTHDANHSAMFVARRANRAVGFLTDVIGISSHVWRYVHNSRHHTYPNIEGADHDIDSGGVLRLSYDHPRRWWHRYQHLYFPLVYLLNFSAHNLRDIRMFVTGRVDQHTQLPHMTAGDRVAFCLGKLLCFLMLWALPAVVCGWTTALAGLAVIAVVFNLTLATVFQLAHIVPDALTPPEFCRAGPTNTWSEHQLATTANFATQSRSIGWLVGGLNFQIEHHLFPRLPHTCYPLVSDYVRTTCQDHGVAYVEYPTFREALRQHAVALRTLGRKD